MTGFPQAATGSRDVPGHLPLLEFFRETWSGLPNSARYRLAGEFGAFVRRLHDNARTPSWEIDVFLARANSWTFHVREAPLARRKSLGEDRRLENLALGYLFVEPHIRQSEALCFLRAYLRGESLSPRGFRQAIAQEVLRRSRVPLHRRRFLAASDLLVEERLEKRHFLRDQSAESEQLARLLLPRLEDAYATGEPLSTRGSKSRAVRSQVNGRDYFLKAFAPSWYGRSSRGIRSWVLSWHFRQCGIPVPRPLLLVPARDRLYLLTEYAQGYRSLADFWLSADRLQRRDVLNRVARVLGRLHRLGWIHGDFNWGNILVGEGRALLLVDLDCAKPLTRRRHFKDAQHFLRDLLRHDGEEWKGYFLDHWYLFSGAGYRFRVPSPMQDCNAA